MSTALTRRCRTAVTAIYVAALASVALPATAWAAECTLPSDLDAMSATIGKAPSCVAAAKIAEDCAFGASGDVSLQESVIAVCERDFLSRLKPAAARAYRHALSVCRKKYARKQGTMYVSAAAICEGKVAQKYSSAALKAGPKATP